MKKRLIIFISLVLVLFFSPNLVQADSSFTLSTTESAKETCPTQFVIYKFVVTNTGDEADTYTVSKSGSASDWAIISPPGFVLDSDESKTIYVYVTPRRDAKTGKYDLEVSVSGSDAGVQETTVDLNVRECHSVDVSALSLKKEVCTGEDANYNLEITNEGIWTENFKISVSGDASSWTSVSDEFLRLAPNEVASISVSVAPEANEVGGYDITVSANSLESNAMGRENMELKINGCYGVDLSLDNAYFSFCENSEVKVPISVKNPGTTTNSFDLSLDGSDWMSLDQNSLTIGAGKTKVVNAVLFPGYGIQGKFPAEVSVESRVGDVEDSVSFDSNVFKCYSVSVAANTKQDIICPGTEQSYSVNVVNTGNFSNKFNLLLDSPDWVSLNTTFLDLDAQQSKDVKIVADPGAAVLEDTYNIGVDVQSQSNSQVSDDSQFKIKIAERESCFGVKITAEKSIAKIARGEGMLIPVVVENQGSERNVFDIDVSGSGSSFAQLNPGSVEISGNSAETTYLYLSVPEKTEKDAYSLSIAARDEDGAVSASSKIYIMVTEEAEVPAVENQTTNDTNKTSPLIFSKVTTLGASFRNEIGNYGTNFPNTIKDRPYSALIALIFVLLVIYAAALKKRGKKDDEFKVLEEIDSESKSKSKKSLWGRFMDWLEEEDDEELIEVVEEKKKPKTKISKKPKKKKKPKTKAKKKGKSGWKKFMDWLEEDETAVVKKKKKTKTKASKKPKKKKKPKTKAKKKPKTKAKKKGKSGWKKFMDWLEEE